LKHWSEERKSSIGLDFSKLKSPETDKMTTKKVKFCKECDKSDKCKACEKIFSNKAPFQSTSIYQIEKDITCYVVANKSMIADLGCPNTVIGEEDVNTFIACLTNFQQEKLEYVEVDEKFKFGPSGPYRCSRKLRFPIKNDADLLWVDVALVKAHIPMLLGNNILKPLEAHIKLFSTGDGMLTLQKTKMKLHETSGGHYTIKLSDLSKLCATVEESVFWTKQDGHRCEKCGKILETLENLKKHTVKKHESIVSSALKTGLNSKQGVEENVFETRIMTDLNTQLNGSPSEKERKLILTMKDLLKMQQKNS
jgi:hypothetical protein